MKRICRVHRILLSKYGAPVKRRSDPMATLITTILSQNTSDTNRDRAYKRLKKRFPTWASVLSARTQNIESAIRPGGLSKAKARYIKNALQSIKEKTGGFSLVFLKNMGLEQAREYLLSLDGVGPKTAAVVLCFSLGKPALPVDTHVYRVSKRLGLIPEKTTVEKAHGILENQISPGSVYSFHLNMIRHGRETCTARKPRCPSCPLRSICAYKNKTTA